MWIGMIFGEMHQATVFLILVSRTNWEKVVEEALERVKKESQKSSEKDVKKQIEFK